MSISKPRRVNLPRLVSNGRGGLSQGVRDGNAVILSGVIDDWPALSKWSPDYFAENYGNLLVRADFDLPHRGSPYAIPANSTRLPLRQFVSHVQRGERCALRDECVFDGTQGDFEFAPLIEAMSERIGRVPVPPKVSPFINVWFGAHTRSGLHWDSADNFLAQIHGTKHVILVSPSDSRNVYVRGRNIEQSAVDPENVDLQSFPRFANATLHVGTLNPGDVLFIPKGWWHFLSTTQVSISLNCFFGKPIGPREMTFRVLRGGPATVGRVMRDFLWHGVLARPYVDTLLSGPPTGPILYWSLRHRVRSLLGKNTTPS